MPDSGVVLLRNTTSGPLSLDLDLDGRGRNVQEWGRAGSPDDSQQLTVEFALRSSALVKAVGKGLLEVAEADDEVRETLKQRAAALGVKPVDRTAEPEYEVDLEDLSRPVVDGKAPYKKVKVIMEPPQSPRLPRTN